MVKGVDRPKQSLKRRFKAISDLNCVTHVPIILLKGPSYQSVEEDPYERLDVVMHLIFHRLRRVEPIQHRIDVRVQRDQQLSRHELQCALSCGINSVFPRHKQGTDRHWGATHREVLVEPDMLDLSTVGQCADLNFVSIN